MGLAATTAQYNQFYGAVSQSAPDAIVNQLELNLFALISRGA